MQSIWQTITAPPVTIPFSLMWLCVFALELIMLPERIRLARYGGYWYMCPYDYRTTQMVSGRRIWHRFASAAVAATWMWYTAMEHSPSTGIRTRRWAGSSDRTGTRSSSIVPS